MEQVQVQVTSALQYRNTIIKYITKSLIDFVIAGITDRFDQPGYTLYKNVEDLLVKAVSNVPHDQCFKEVTSFYKDDLDPSTQLKMPIVHFVEQGSQVILQDCVNYLRSLSAAQSSFYSQVCILVQLILVMPATNAVSESFPAMRRLKVIYAAQ